MKGSGLFLFIVTAIFLGAHRASYPTKTNRSPAAGFGGPGFPGVAHGPDRGSPSGPGANAEGHHAVEL